MEISPLLSLGEICPLSKNPYLQQPTPELEPRRRILVDFGMRVGGAPVLFRAVGGADDDGNAEYGQDQLFWQGDRCMADVMCRYPTARAVWLTSAGFTVLAGQAGDHLWVLAGIVESQP